ncbi:vomeronasal type-2 receptor 26-like [Pogona vitticeps]
MPKHYQHILAFAFALHEINKKAELLPNTTVGSKIYDNAFDSWRAFRTTVDFLYVVKGKPLNYNCGMTEKALAVIGGLTSRTSMQMAHILNVYSIPQISYGAFDSRLSDKIQFPFLYRMIPSEDPQYTGIVLLLEHFGWNWIGLVVSDDDSGETFLQTLRPKLLQSRICIAETIVIPIVSEYIPVEIQNRILRPIVLAFLRTEINVMLVHGDRQSLEGLRAVLDIYEFRVMKPQRKVWVTTAQWDYTALTAGIKLASKTFNGTLSFSLHTNMVPGFEDFLEDIDPFHSNLYFIHQFWCTVFACSLPLHGLQYPGGNNCTGQEKFLILFFSFSDAEQCQECPEDKYPNENHSQCLPKKLIYLSYEEPLGAALAFASLFLSMGTAMVMRTFIRHRDTPIVKANNWSITCTLLSSLLICFLCPLLFIGWPGKVTCLLRQMVFGIIFTLAVACILAKTITVVLAFMATKPGNRARNWIGKRPAVLVIIPSSFLQVGICGVWLAMAHPFLELDMHSQRDEILLECNDGSPLMFYMVLGYMGLLAVISFLVAFSARKLPDTFNEAKLITFSMLVFCSVWISFVPTYLSTKGKYMVAVEIFSILASGAGLLGCLFLPKLYIIILRPELNTRKHLVRRQDCFQVEQSCH